jgi:hypothetical protein
MSEEPVLVVQDTWQRLLRECAGAAVIAGLAAGLLLLRALDMTGNVVLWATALGVPASLLWRIHDWSSEEPYLIANREGLWLKQWSGLDVIDWDDVVRVERISRRQFRVEIKNREGYRARLAEEDLAARKHLFLGRSIIIDLRALRVEPDGLVRIVDCFAARAIA